MQIIEKLGSAQFKCWWEEVPSEVMNLDFNSLLSEFNLRGKAYSLLHWQGVPFGFRQWGVYCCLSDEYRSIGTDQVLIQKPSRLLQIPDQFLKQGAKPSAVICYEGAISQHHELNKILATV